MKRKLLLLLFLLFTQKCLLAQQVRFEQGPLEKVLSKARELNKPVFILVSPPVSSASLPEHLVKAYNTTGLDDQQVTKELNRTFLNYKVPFGSSDAKALSNLYSISEYPTYLFLNPDRALIHRASKTSSNPQYYLQQISSFKTKRSGENNLSYFQKEYRQGRRDRAFLKRYMLLQQDLGILVSQELLEEYVDQLPVSVADSFPEVVFIHEFGPVVESKVFKFARLNQQMVNKLYSTLPLSKRLAINNKIINNTSKQAIEHNNQALALKGANFARSTWGKEYRKGQRTFDDNMLRFYRATGDTANYLPRLVAYYDRYYMTIKADSVEEMMAAEDSLINERRKNYEEIKKQLPEVAKSETRSVVRVSSGNSERSFYTNLNNAAYQVYSSGTTNNMYLSRALAWSKRTVAENPKAAFYDTYAHVLYKLEFFNEAEAMQEKAVELAKDENLPTTHFLKELNKIKQRKL